jgi:alpha-beta hydrolase superfamily lysophospholipase
VKAYRTIDLPLLYLFSDSDPIASPHDNRTLSDQLNSPDKTVVVRRGERHEILNEVNKEQTYESITQWIQARLS